MRKNKGLSQAALAKKLGYKAGASVSKMEANVTPPDLFALAKIAEVLGADLHWLIIGKPGPSTEGRQKAYRGVVAKLAKYVSAEVARLLDLRDLAEAQYEELLEKVRAGEDVPSKLIKDKQAEISGIQFQLTTGALRDRDYVDEALKELR